jgi:hypothetical protein
LSFSSRLDGRQACHRSVDGDDFVLVRGWYAALVARAGGIHCLYSLKVVEYKEDETRLD